ncbi:MAG: phosphate propanoyltransferase [Treponemataceae bacterium]
MNKTEIAQKIYERILAKGLVMIEISARHIHLSQNDIEFLFGKDYQLTPVRELSQPGQYLCKERATLIGIKGSIQNVAILGPQRSSSQVEIIQADTRVLGVQTPLRLSGNTAQTPSITIAVGDKKLVLKEGLIIAKRHIHLHPTDAKRLNLADKERVNVRVLSNRPVIFEDTIIRVTKESSFAMHIDTEEANAAGIIASGYGLIQKIEERL